ncbi:NAD(P)H-dependent oxidoreductase [Brucella intermedia]|uniref:NAD(P)H-dependent oxidoreductase n=1 Tax=Brucella intermedia TaxID=94625 RepID=UPI00224B4DF8|nr:NAD(P)H-dependent oxidoreductase [Brucella intermedia]
MNILIVLAHPEPQSFNHALTTAATHVASEMGNEVRVSDLYADGFSPDEHARHFKHRANPVRFDAQTEQRFHAANGTLPLDVRQQIDNVLWADVVIFQFPLWWFGMPGILKGWMDRVFVYGELYSGSRRFDTGVCRGKRAVLSVTLGSSTEASGCDGQEGDTSLILWPTNYALHYLGFTVLEPRIVAGIRSGFSDEEVITQQHFLKAAIKDHQRWIAGLDKATVVAFNAPEDWDEQRRLKPGAPVYHPFIRHRSAQHG